MGGIVSQRAGPAGTIEKSTKKVSHPALPEEKSGGDACCCAAAPAVSAVTAKPVNTPPASHFAANMDICLFPCIAPSRAKKRFA
jgi:hypothetical protein